LDDFCGKAHLPDTRVADEEELEEVVVRSAVESECSAVAVKVLNLLQTRRETSLASSWL
jgi:hypothetical protein